MKILFTGGGTAGHIMPLVAIARELRRLYRKEDLTLYYVSPKDNFAFLQLEQEGIRTRTIFSGKIRRYFEVKAVLQNIADIAFNIPFGFLQSFFLLVTIRPNMVFGKGGYGTVPVLFAARLLRIPIFLHESDIVPGLSNRTAAKWAKKIFISFPKTEYFDLSQAIAVGNPIKKELMEGTNEDAAERLGITFERPVLLFMGGSLGAEAVNDFVLLTINELLQDYEVIHVVGRKNSARMQMELQIVLDKNLERYYHFYGFLDEPDLKAALKAATLVISRAGGAAIFEIAACGKPSILVPLPTSAANHQSKNAYEYAGTGAAIVIEQENLTPHFFAEKLRHLLSQPEKLAQMKEAALRFSKPLAAAAIAREILEYLHANA